MKKIRNRTRLTEKRFETYEEARKLKDSLCEETKYDKVKIFARSSGYFDVVTYGTQTEKEVEVESDEYSY